MSLFCLIFIASLAPILCSLAFARLPNMAKYLIFIFWGISGLFAVIIGVGTLLAPVDQSTNFHFSINSGFPNLIFTFQLDPLSGFFLILLGLVILSVAIYGPDYLRIYSKRQTITKLTFFTSLFLLSMYLVVLAADAFSFMMAWEIMSISSYFLVIYQHEKAINRSAAFLYLVMAQISGLLILFGYGILIKFSGGSDFGFSALSHAATNLTPIWAALVFTFGLLGFGMKAGMVPFHVWLPRAHPVAPSHISALMSGVMLKIAIYGLLRLCFSLLGKLYWQWGMVILSIGIVSALIGALYAVVQNDLKKLLAYSSLENIGIIFISIGLAMIFLSSNHPNLAALALVAALYHCLNHALFKTLLFLGAGAVLQYAHEHDLEKMGGLIHYMPFTALFFLIGCISISAFPLTNAFVSEWLTFQAALKASVLKGETLRIIIPLAAAALALTSAITAASFVKMYGVAFLGKPRSKHVRHAGDPGMGMIISMGVLSLFCLGFGLLPTLTINVINSIPMFLFGEKISSTSWLWLFPVKSSAYSYSSPLIWMATIIILGLCFLLVYLISRPSKTIQAKPWDCGFGGLNSRMQISGTAFAMPLRRIFQGTWKVTEKTEEVITKINHKTLGYQVQIGEWVWQYVYEQIPKLVSTISRLLTRVQGGNVRIYLSYTLVTLIFLLWVVA